MTTIKDVAREAGVSFATVSRALRGMDGVNPQTRERVLQVASQLDYLASPAAVTLRSGRARLIAVVAPLRTEWVSSSIIAAINRELAERDHQAILIDLIDHGGEGRQRLTTGMLRHRVDGIITLNTGLDSDELTLADRLGLPVVAVGTHVPGRSTVRINDASTTRQATEHLIGLGHTRIAYVGPLPEHHVSASTAQLRLDSFVASLHEHGLRAPRSLLVLDGDWTAASAAQAIRPILQRATRPSAVLAASDEMAFGALQTARQIGLSVPSDLSIIGIDDHVLADVMDLTTMRQDLSTQGRLAAAILLRALAHPRGEIENVIIPTQLIVRGTTAQPARHHLRPRQRGIRL